MAQERKKTAVKSKCTTRSDPTAPLLMLRISQALNQLLGETERGRCLRKELKEYMVVVAAGGDPVGALHGHYCQPGCVHWPAMTPAQRRTAKRVLKALKAHRKEGK
jgi:hypothetical protein